MRIRLLFEIVAARATMRGGGGNEMKRIALRFLEVAAALAFIVCAPVGLFFLLMTLKFNPEPPAWHYPKPASALAAQRQDIDAFRQLIALDRSYSDSARATAARATDQLAALDTPLAQEKFRVALMRIVALADNGHSRLGSDPGALPRELPVRVARFSDGLYITRAKSGLKELLGSRVTAIDGVPIEAAVKTIEALRGGTSGWRQINASVYLTVQDVLYGAGIAASPARSVWSVTTPSGANISRVLDAYEPPKDEPFEFAPRWYSPEPLKGMSGWDSFLPDKARPIAFSQFDSAFRRDRIPGSCVLFVQLKSNEDVDGQRIGPFISATKDDMERRPPCAAIFDLRFNTGGDYTNTYAFASALPALVRPGGRIFVLTSSSTFSAGITTTGAVKQSGGNRVMILGEPVGDRLAFYSEGNRGCLPNYHLCVSYETGKHDYGKPCRDPDRCYWLNWFYPVRVQSLAPDETIQTSFADWRAGRDPVFDRALALARSTH
jgi:hypothetical protein